ncbi:MAG: hypothetical protein KJ077_05275 [Anaerolineae bacterium]|nr:hypothetical protein [Anaerolineae bacterium]
MKRILLMTLMAGWIGMTAVRPLPSPWADQRNLPVNQTYIAGVTYWGRNNYIEYVAGDLPIIISAPHGGYLKPKELPDRRWGLKGIDSRSQENAREVAAYIKQITGKQPHLIINHLHRDKLDANRSIEEAAQNDPWAEQAWSEFHAFIEAAKMSVTTQCGKGTFLDLHTHADTTQWVYLGFGLRVPHLDRSDELLNSPEQKDRSTVKSLAYTEGVYFPEIIRGQTSLGGLLQAQGFPSTPSPTYPIPIYGNYRNGGYNVFRHGSNSRGQIDGIQVETHYKLLNDEARAAYSHALALAIVNIYERHYPCPASYPAPQVSNVYFPLLTHHLR